MMDQTDGLAHGLPIPSNVPDQSQISRPKRATFPRTMEFALGLTGALMGVLAAIIVLFLGDRVNQTVTTDSGFISILAAAILNQIKLAASILSSIGAFSLLLALTGLAGSVLVLRKGKLGGFLMILGAVGCLVYFLPGLLLLAAGIVSLRKPDQKPDQVRWKWWLPIGIAACLITGGAITAGLFAWSPDTLPTNESATNDLQTEYSFNENVMVGDLSFWFLSAHTTNVAAFAEDEAVTQVTGNYLVLRFRFNNQGQNVFDINKSLLTLVQDDTGASFPPCAELHHGLTEFPGSLSVDSGSVSDFVYLYKLGDSAPAQNRQAFTLQIQSPLSPDAKKVIHFKPEIDHDPAIETYIAQASQIIKIQFPDWQPRYLISCWDTYQADNETYHLFEAWTANMVYDRAFYYIRESTGVLLPGVPDQSKPYYPIIPFPGQ